MTGKGNGGRMEEEKVTVKEKESEKDIAGMSADLLPLLPQKG